MAVKDEIALIFAGVGTQQEKIALAGKLRALRMAQNAALISRPYIRNGYWFDIVEAVAIGNVLRVIANIREGNAGGPTIIGPGDPLNPVFMVDPITQIQTGADINGKPVYSENLSEALRVMIDRTLAERLAGNA